MSMFKMLSGPEPVTADKIRKVIIHLDSLQTELASEGSDSQTFLNESVKGKETIEKILDLCDSAFISKDGRTQYTKILQLWSNGKYRIVPGETDSFLDIVTVRGRIRIMEL